MNGNSFTLGGHRFSSIVFTWDHAPFPLYSSMDEPVRTESVLPERLSQHLRQWCADFETAWDWEIGWRNPTAVPVLDAEYRRLAAELTALGVHFEEKPWWRESTPASGDLAST